MTFIHLSDLPAKEMAPGAQARFVHSGHTTTAYWDIAAGTTLATHQHPHEQFTSIIEGEFELTVDGETRRCKAGDAALIPGGAPHSGKAISACRIIYVFYPERQEYK